MPLYTRPVRVHHRIGVQLGDIRIIVWISEGDRSPLPAGDASTGCQIVSCGHVAEGTSADGGGRCGGRDEK